MFTSIGDKPLITQNNTLHLGIKRDAGTQKNYSRRESQRKRLKNED